MSLYGDHSGEQCDYAQDVYVYHLVNAATVLMNTTGREVGAHNSEFLAGPSLHERVLQRSTLRGGFYRPSSRG